MKRLIAISSLLIFMLISCVDKPYSGPNLAPEANRKSISNIPDWYLTMPVQEGFRFQSATATSRDLQVAMNKAEIDAQARLSASIESEMEGYTKRIVEETGIGAESNLIDRYSQTQGQVMSTALKDYTVAEKAIVEEKSGDINIYRGYVLIKWNENAANERLLSQLKSDKEIADAIRETELVKEMEDKVEAYRKRMNKN